LFCFVVFFCTLFNPSFPCVPFSFYPTRQSSSSGFDWVRLLQKEIQAPWIPKLKSKKDTAFFEPPDEPEDNRPYEDDGTGWDKDF